MTMVPLGGLTSSAAGAPLSQSAGSETERAQKDSLIHHRQVDANEKAERAAGIGQTEQDQESSERDADGRRLWEAPDKASKANKHPSDAADGPAGPLRQSKDATGQSGTQLDLTG
jgi:hypothetical protein